ncbi:MAG TPA: c-type cytochrome domain-containing protein [Planctomycetota bacterium]|nr:c-type cytochrome domain-containing protein [Planctomycetota bacterium]
MSLLQRLIPAALLLLALSGPVRSDDDKPEFSKDIQPILKAHCLACHTHGQVKGELRLDTIELMLKGGESGPAIVKGDAEKSLLYQVVAGKEELVMPPKKNKVGATPLNAKEMDLLKRWIDAGAPATPASLVLHTEPPQWRPLPPGLNPIHSVAMTGDAQLAACGRANQIFVYSLGGIGALSARLIDPALREGGVADRDYVQALAFSPDGTLLASGGYRTIRLWRKRPAPATATLETGAGAGVLAASPDGKLLATAGPDNGIVLWDLATGIKTQTLSGHTGPVLSLAFSTEGGQLLSGSADKNLRLWTLAGGASVSVDVGQEIHAVAFVLEGKRLAAACGDLLIRLYTVPAPGAPGDKPRELKGHTAKITALRTVGPGKQLLSGSEDGSLRLWNAESGKEDRKMDHGAPVTDLAVQADGKRWVSAGGTTAKLWKQNGELQSTLKGDRLAAHAQTAAELSLAFYKEEIAYFKAAATDGEKLVAAESENVKKAADRLATLTKETSPKEEAGKKAAQTKAELEKSLADTAEGLKKATAAREPAEKAARTATEAAAKAKSESDKAAKAAAALKPDAAPEEAAKVREAAEAAQKTADAAAQEAKTAQEGAAAAAKAIADLGERQKDLDPKLKAAAKTVTEGTQATQSLSAAQQNHERLLQVEKRGQEALAAAKSSLAAAETQVKTADDALAAAKKAVTDSERPIRKAALSADGRLVATSGEETTVKTWSAETGKSGEDYGPLDAAPQSVTILNNGRLLTAAGTSVRVWTQASDWTLERTIGDGGLQSPILDRVLALTFSADGKSLVSGGGIPARTGEIKIWNPATGALEREIKDAHSDTVFTLAFSRDGRLLASGGADKLIKIFDAKTGAFIRLFEGHTQHVLGLAWKRSGRILVSAGADKVAKVWDLVTGEQLKTIEGFRKEVTSIAWLEGPNEMLLASGDGQLRTAKEDGNKTRGYPFGKEYIESAAASMDGRVIVAGGSDSVLRIFEAGKEKLTLGFDPP